MIELHKATWIVFITLWIIRVSCALQSFAATMGLTYTREDLLQLRSSMLCSIKPVHCPPGRNPTEEKREARRGANQVEKATLQTPLSPPSSCQMYSLSGTRWIYFTQSVWWRGPFKEACIIALSETWLDEGCPRCRGTSRQFYHLQADRTRESGKERGGGVCVYVNNRWCNNHLLFTQQGLHSKPGDADPIPSPLSSPKGIPHCHHQLCLYFT